MNLMKNIEGYDLFKTNHNKMLPRREGGGRRCQSEFGIYKRNLQIQNANKEICTTTTWLSPTALGIKSTLQICHTGFHPTINCLAAGELLIIIDYNYSSSSLSLLSLLSFTSEMHMSISSSSSSSSSPPSLSYYHLHQRCICPYAQIMTRNAKWSPSYKDTK